jgi:protein O-GlcNAc transferase
MDTVPTILKQAMAAHRTGNLAEAERLYQSVLRIDARQFDALHLLGVVAAQRGNHRDADRLLAQALAIDPRSAAAHANRAFTLKELGQFEAALASCDKALAIQPDDIGVIANRAIVLKALNRLPEALACFDRALAMQPNDAGMLNGRGNLLMSMKRPADALHSYDKALALGPKHPEAWNDRGNALAALKRFDDALASYDRALALRPDDARTLSNRGVALTELRRFADSLASFDRVLAINPDHIEALNNRGIVLTELGRYEDAFADYERILATGEHAEALNNRGNALVQLRRFDEALASYDRALAVKPDHTAALNNRAGALVGMGRWNEALAAYDRLLAIQPNWAEALANRGNALMELKRHEEAARDFAAAIAADPECKYARGKLLHARMQSCDWSAWTRESALLHDEVEREKPCVTPFPFLALSDSPAHQLLCAGTYVQDKCPPSPTPLWRGERYGHDRIRVAYVSADFREHATAYLIADLLERHDKDRFEIVAVSMGGGDAPSPMRKRIEGAVERLVDIDRMGDNEAACLIRDMEVDIAVDLMGFTQGGRPEILARRPAPVQVSYLAYPGTMGAEYVDYLIADRFVIPEEQRAHYGEKIAFLPDAYQANDSKRTGSYRVPSRGEAGLPQDGFVFCCFNQSFKIVPDVFAVWMRLLRQIEGSVLWLLDGGASAVRNLRHAADQRGFAAHRLIFAPRIDVDDHLARHALADLFLDTLPYNAHTTASDALRMGLPVVTCVGNTFAARVAGSLLRAAGCPELIAGSPADYEALALTLARNGEVRTAIRDRLVRGRNVCRLFDTDRLRRHIESAYETMWQRSRDGMPPADFAVAAID